MAVVAGAPVLTVVALLEPPEASAEVVLGWFCEFLVSRGCSKRPRSKDMIVVGLPFFFVDLAIDVDVVEL